MRPDRPVNTFRTPPAPSDGSPSKQQPVNSFRTNESNQRSTSDVKRDDRTVSWTLNSNQATKPTARRAKATASQSDRSKIRSIWATGWQQWLVIVRRYPVLKQAYQLFWQTALLVFLASLAWVIVLKWVPVWFTPLTISRKIEAWQANGNTEIHKNWQPYDKINREAGLAVVASEDQAFPYHWGFDFDEIQDALKENKYRKHPRGASTISQQVAKNVFLWNGRSYIRKGLEVYFTVLIELIWGKERILEVYLNIAETGPMTFGVEAAAERFYHHPASSLSRAEAARIAAVLPNPLQFSISNPSTYIQRRTRQISRQMRALGGQRYLREL